MNITHTQENAVDLISIFRDAKSMLQKGMAKVCYFPVLAIDRQGNRVSLSSPNAHFLTPAGAIIKAIANNTGDKDKLRTNTDECINELSKQIPSSFAFNYDRAISVDLACLSKSAEEIISAFDKTIDNLSGSLA